MLRLATGAVLIPLLWGLIKHAPAGWLYVVAVVAIAGACYEAYRMFDAMGHRPFTWIGLAACMAVVWSFADLAPHFGLEEVLATLLPLTVAASMWRRPDPPAMLRTILGTVFPVVFIAFLLGYVVALRGAPGPDGSDLLLLLFVCVIFSDTGAFYVGTRFGRNPLARRLSPKKSWEGVVGGVAAAIVGAVIAHYWFFQRLPLGHAVVLGLALAVTGILGDLAESLLKRAAGVKDSSRLLPGHGGLLDRTDSLLFAAPLLYYYYQAFLQGGS